MSDIAEEFSPSAKTNKNTKVLSDAGNKTNGSPKKKMKPNTTKLRRSKSFEKSKNGENAKSTQQSVSAFFQKLSSPKFNEKPDPKNDSIEDFDLTDSIVDVELVNKSIKLSKDSKKDESNRMSTLEVFKSKIKAKLNAKSKKEKLKCSDNDNGNISNNDDSTSLGSKSSKKGKKLKNTKSEKGSIEIVEDCKENLKEQDENKESKQKLKESNDVNENENDLNSSTAQKKQVNAFQFMMDSRNKSIGSNSPGKDVEKDTSPLNENKEKLNERKQKLESWANMKGGLKRKLDDEERGEIIKDKLEVRAKRLKKMLTGEEEEEEEESVKVAKRKRIAILFSSDSDDSDKEVKKVEKESCKKMHKPLEKVETPKTNNSRNSPKKQVGLLSFFEKKKNEEKVEKDEGDDVKVIEDEASEEEKDGPIKFKMFSPTHSKKKKKTGKKSKKQVKESKVSSDVVEEDEYFNVEDKDAELTLLRNRRVKPKIKRKKRLFHKSVPKIRIKLPSSDDDTYSIVSESSNVDDIDNIDIEVSNESDTLFDISEEVIVIEEEHNFRKSTRNTVRKSYVEYVHLEDSDEETTNKTEKKSKQNVKIAPVFVKSTPKPKLAPEELQARKEFLLSGVPTSLKKFMQQKELLEERETEIFPAISHILQKPTNTDDVALNYWNLPKVELDFHLYKCRVSPVKHKEIIHLRIDKSFNEENIDIRPHEKVLSYKSPLKLIKEENENYPVFKCFKQLSGKCGLNFDTKPEPKSATKKKKRGRKSKDAVKSPEVVVVEENPVEMKSKFAMWTEKYKPMCSDDILGNFKSVLEVKRWLQSWLDYGDECSKVKKRKRNDSSSSEFDTTDGESRDSFRLLNNTIILTGPNGSGKSTAVYAICNELGINVLELNASSKRTGKRLLQELQEATQSHQVRNQKPTALTSFFQKNAIMEKNSKQVKLKNGKINKAKHPLEEAKPSEENNTPSTKMCLLLVEDVDIVFDQDEGFLSALSTLLNTSKRPIVLIASDTSCSHLYRFVNQYRTIEFSPLSTRILAPWLQILCLVEGLKVDQTAMKTALELNKGDMRKTLLQLQYWVQTGGDNRFDKTAKNEKTPRRNSTANKFKNCEKPKTSFLNCLKEPISVDSDTNDELISEDLPDDSFIKNDVNHANNDLYVHSNLQGSFQKRYCSFEMVDLGKCWRTLSRSLADDAEKTEKLSLSQISVVCDSLSFTDFAFNNVGVKNSSCFADKFYSTSPKDSLELDECMESGRNDFDFTCELTNELIRSSFEPFNTSVEYPDCPVNDERWKTEQHSCSDKFHNLLNLSAATDRKSFALDYFPALRNIVRSEAVRSATTTKRNNRFYNYLETLGLDANQQTLKTAEKIFRVDS